MSAFVHPDEQAAFNVLLQLGVPARDARKLAKKHTTPNVFTFLAVIVARLAVRLPPDQNPVADLRRVLSAAASTRTADCPFFYPLEWPAVCVGGPADGHTMTIGFLCPSRPYLDRDGVLHRYDAQWWFPVSHVNAFFVRPRRAVELKYGGKIREPRYGRRIDEDEDDGDGWKRGDRGGPPRGGGH